jgi:hypothetical protein
MNWRFIPVLAVGACFVGGGIWGACAADWVVWVVLAYAGSVVGGVLLVGAGIGALAIRLERRMRNTAEPPRNTAVVGDPLGVYGADGKRTGFRMEWHCPACGHTADEDPLYCEQCGRYDNPPMFGCLGASFLVLGLSITMAVFVRWSVWWVVVAWLLVVVSSFFSVCLAAIYATACVLQRSWRRRVGGGPRYLAPEAENPSARPSTQSRT